MTIGSFMPLRSVWDTHLATLAAEFPEHKFLAGLAPDSPDVSRLDVMIAGRLPGATYLASPKLKALFQPFTGINHLPLEEFSARGVTVYNVHANAFDVAERALALTLAFYGRVIEYHNDLARDLWHGFWVRAGSEDNWNSIYGKSCVILGTGAIGVALAGLLKAFSCRVTGWRRRPDAPLPANFDEVIPDLEQAIESAEIVFIALPATPLTDGLISRELLRKMKGKFLVNVGRGSIVDEEGLYEALKDKVLAGAAIDTWYSYPPTGKVGAPSKYPITQLPNVVLSPHVGGSTNQASAKSISQTVDNIRQYLERGECESKADLLARY